MKIASASLPEKIFLATNNGDIGGGEVMLFNIARQLRSLGKSVTIVGPAQPAEVVDAAADQGFDVITLPAVTRAQYMAQLGAWNRRRREGLLWCNGLVPAFATSGSKNRIVHLHQIPTGKLKWLVAPALAGSSINLIPSEFAAQRVKKTTRFYNWTQEIRMPLETKSLGKSLKVGFIGRPSTIKGTDLLAQAIEKLNQTGTPTELLVAGEAKFIDSQDQQIIGAQLEKLGDAVKLLGWVAPADFLQKIDVLVVPSRVEETFGLVVSEAMSARVPVVISDAGALPEIVGKDYPWVFVNGNSVELLEVLQKVNTLLRSDQDEIEKVVNSSYWRWLENFSPQAGQVRLQHLLDDFLGE